MALASQETELDLLRGCPATGSSRMKDATVTCTCIHSANNNVVATSTGDLLNLFLTSRAKPVSGLCEKAR